MDQSTFSLNEDIIIPIMYTAKAAVKLKQYFFQALILQLLWNNLSDNIRGPL